MVACSASPSSDAQSDDTGEDALTASQGIDDATGVQVSADRVFWVANNGLFTLPKPSSSANWNWGPSSTSTVKSKRLAAGAIGGDSGATNAYAVDGDTVYAITGKSLIKLPAKGGTRTVYAFPLNQPGKLVVDQDNVYVADLDNLYSLPKDFSAAPTALAPIGCTTADVGMGAQALEQSDSALFAHVCQSRLVRISKSGGAATTILNGNIDSVAVDGKTLYAIHSDQVGAGATELVSMPVSGTTPTRLIETDAQSVKVVGNTILLGQQTKLERFDVGTQKVSSVAKFSYEHPLSAFVIDGSSYFYALGNVHSGLGEAANTGELGAATIP